MDNLYNIGDQVLVKEKYDPGKSKWNYRCAFSSEMIGRYGGHVCTIVGLRISDGRLFPDDVPNDRYEYTLKDNGGTNSWTSSMFEPEF